MLSQDDNREKIGEKTKKRRTRLDVKSFSIKFSVKCFSKIY